MTTKKTITPIEILLVEDNPGDIQLTKEAVEDCKMINNLSVAEDGEKALNFLFRRNGYESAPKPDLIILDLNLPKVDGREVLTVIKKDEKLKLIPVVILTTSKAEEDVLNMYELHANCYITKPINIDSFFDVVKAIENFWIGIVVLPE